jgi:hypothetical protein
MESTEARDVRARPCGAARLAPLVNAPSLDVADVIEVCERVARQRSWRRIVGLRDVLAHACFAIDEDIIWDLVHTEVPALPSQFVDLRGRLAGPAS